MLTREWATLRSTHAARREVHGRRGRKGGRRASDVRRSGSTAHAGRALKGEHQEGNDHSGFRPWVARLPGGSKALESSHGPTGFTVRRIAVNGKRAGKASRGARLPRRIKALEVEPQERYRDETSPER
jgi:hypothetical protein